MTFEPTMFVAFDLDSTLRDTRHRAHLAAAPPHTHEGWIDYSKACVDDAVIEGTLMALRMHRAAGFGIAIISGSNDEARDENIQFLDKFSIPYDILRLRTATDIQHNGLYKAQAIRDLKAEGKRIVLFYEDQQKAAALIIAEGVPVVLVNPGYDDEIGANFNGLGT